MPRTRKTRRPLTNAARVGAAFDREALRKVCTMRETAFPSAYGLETVKVPQAAPSDFYAYRDNGSSVLAVAHLDTVSPHSGRACHYVDTESGPVVFSRALDDRLGAYVLLDLLPRLDVNVDVLLTVGEESGQSTAAYFDPPKAYDWVIEFDRGGTDVVMYQFEDDDTCDLVRECGARVGEGIFSDIAYLEHLGVKAFNWGVGYQDYHSERSHAFLEDTFRMVGYFLDFHALNVDTRMPHDELRAIVAGTAYGEDDDDTALAYWRATGELGWDAKQA